MKTLALSTASRSLAEYASELDDEVVLLTRRNRPVAAIVPLRNVDRETLALSTHPGFLALIERSRREVAAGKTLSFAQMRAALAAQGGASAATPSTRGRGRTPIRPPLSRGRKGPVTGAGGPARRKRPGA
jgi:antitoxin (DNA-binding transcriptional repressor) of toxin-antitoxin stability system